MNRTQNHIVGVIPARLASTRFPGKPLAPILGIPMIGHVHLRCKMSDVLKEVYVATPDEPIREYVEGLGGKAIMTSVAHQRASDRCAEALRIIEEETQQRIDILVMIQGDEPLVHPAMIGQAVEPLLNDRSVKVSNLLGRITSDEEFQDPNEIKVVVDREFNALYFSRNPIPSMREEAGTQSIYKQVCIIPFDRDFLLRFADMEPTPLEIAESIDMLRILQHGYRVRMVPTDHQMQSVDTEEDLRKAALLMAKDPLFQEYSMEYADRG